MIFRFGTENRSIHRYRPKIFDFLPFAVSIGNIFPSNFTWKSWNGNDEKFVVIIYGFSGIYYIVEGFFFVITVAFVYRTLDSTHSRKKFK